MNDMNAPMIELAADFHVHPDYSIDAEGSLDEYCQAALNGYVLELCFTTHYDADPKHPDDSLIVIDGKKERLSDDAIGHYVKDVARVHEEYGMLGMMVRSGLEFGWFDGCEKELSRVIKKFPLDYKIGAVHTINGLCICCKDSAKKLFEKMPLDKIADNYFEKLYNCAGSGLFDCIAHIDVYRKYGLEYYGEEINTIHRGRIEKLFDIMKANEVGYEINTSAIRHGLSEYYPTMEIVNLAREKGVCLKSVGSDAHKPSQLALDFEVASTVAYELFPYTDE
ncbi:MAG: histidinol-phosphatase HisJ family protein [Candidatus Zixiibacteriota bacterium]